jgi:hypothetical protein
MHRMILDMIQGCRYLRRSTDRWLLPKNSTTRLEDSKFGMGPVLLCRCSIPIKDIKGLYLYPCPNMTPDRLRVQHLIPKLMLWRQCPSCTRHQFVPSLYLGHVITYSQKLPFKAQIVLLPNDGVLPSASIFTESSEEIFPVEWHFVTKLSPQVSPFPVPIFGVNLSSLPPVHPSLSQDLRWSSQASPRKN